MCRAFWLIILLLPFGVTSSYGQFHEDKRKIYTVLTNDLPEEHAPISNITFGKVDYYDIDGDLQKWFYRGSSRGHGEGDPTMAGTIIDVVPITYSQTIFEFLKEKEIAVDTNALFEAISEQKMDTLSNYIGGYDFLPLKKRSLRHTKIGNLFKRKQVVSFSAILFGPAHQLAFVKRFNMAKKTAAKYNLSALFILQKEADDWKIIGMLEQKFSSDSGR